MPNYETFSIPAAESVAVGADGLQWIPVRRRLGIGAFGVNGFRAAGRGDAVIEDHVESPGQEELYVVLQGAATFTVGGEAVEAGPGTAVYVPDPELKRGAVATEDDTVVLAVGGWREKPYHSLPWEPIYLAQGAMRRGDWAAAIETLEREAGEHRDTATVRFRLACCHARLGEDDAAIDELRRAYEVNPGIRERAEREDALAGLRDREDWPG